MAHPILPNTELLRTYDYWLPIVGDVLAEEHAAAVHDVSAEHVAGVVAARESAHTQVMEALC